MILNLHQEELINLESNLLNKLIEQTYSNDIRTIFIVHANVFYLYYPTHPLCLNIFLPKNIID